MYTAKKKKKRILKAGNEELALEKADFPIQVFMLLTVKGEWTMFTLFPFFSLFINCSPIIFSNGRLKTLTRFQDDV